MMTEEEKFIFDLEGYLIIKNILTANEVDEMNNRNEMKGNGMKCNEINERTRRPS